MGATQTAALQEYTRLTMLTKDEKRTGIYSELEFRPQSAEAGTPYAYIAPQGPGSRHQLLPTVLAVSDGDQHHVSKFFRTWRADARAWQVVVPLRGATDAPLLYQTEGLDVIQRFMKRLLADDDRALLPNGVEGKRFHLVGLGAGGGAVTALAVCVPELVASLTVVKGFIPRTLTDPDLERLRRLPCIRMYLADGDERKWVAAMHKMKDRLDAVCVDADFQVYKGPDITQLIDIGRFWQGLQLARPSVDEDKRPATNSLEDLL